MNKISWKGNICVCAWKFNENYSNCVEVSNAVEFPFFTERFMKNDFLYQTQKGCYFQVTYFLPKKEISFFPHLFLLLSFRIFNFLFNLFYQCRFNRNWKIEEKNRMCIECKENLHEMIEEFRSHNRLSSLLDIPIMYHDRFLSFLRIILFSDQIFFFSLFTGNFRLMWIAAVLMIF
jgi:hypothetical protein